MQREHACACLLTTQRDLYRIALLVTVSAPDLYRGRNGDRPRYRANDVLHEAKILEAAGSGIFGGDLFHRAAEIDVEKIRAVDLFDEGRGFAHRHRIRSEDLHADRTFLVVKTEIIVRALTAAANAFGAHKLAHHHIRPKAAAQTAKRALAHARLGREIERRFT